VPVCLIELPSRVFWRDEKVLDGVAVLPEDRDAVGDLVPPRLKMPYLSNERAERALALLIAAPHKVGGGAPFQGIGRDAGIFERLHDAGISFSIELNIYGDFRVYLGDEIEGHRAMGSCLTWNEVMRWFDRYARIHYPSSRYAAGDGQHRGVQAG
jgi:hypothetical protein